MIEEYIVYADEHEVLVQVIGKLIVSTGPLLRPFIGKKLKSLNQHVEKERWLILPIRSLQ